MIVCDTLVQMNMRSYVTQQENPTPGRPEVVLLQSVAE